MSESTEVTLQEIERMNEESLDKLATDIELLSQHLTVPEEALELFVGNIKGVRMLDVGCGWASYVERFIEHGLEYTGIDLSSKMIAASRKKQPQLRFEQMSFRNLLFDDASFDGVWCSCVLYHEPKNNVPTVLREFKRVLISGGIITVVMPYTGLSSEDISENDDGIKLYMATYEVDEFVDLMTSAGFIVENAILRLEAGSLYVLART